MAKLAGRIAERQRGAITTLRQFRRPDRGDFARRKIERAALYAKEELGRDAVAVYSPEVETWAKGKEAPSEEEPGVEALVAGTVEEGKQIPQFRSGEEPPESIRNAVVRIREQVQDAAVERDRRLRETRRQGVELPRHRPLEARVDEGEAGDPGAVEPVRHRGLEPGERGAREDHVDPQAAAELPQGLCRPALARRRAPEDGIYLTEFAAGKVKEFAKAENKEGYGLKITAADNAGREPSYAMDFQGKAGVGEKTFDFHGVSIFLDGESFKNLAGAEIDFLETAYGSGFKITNPNFFLIHCHKSSRHRYSGLVTLMQLA